MSKTVKLWLALALVVVFLAGVAIGLFAGALHVRHRFVFRHGPQMGDRMREHLRRELKLTPEQAAKIDPVVDRMAAQLESIRQETSRRVGEAMNASHQELIPLLTPEQRQRLEEMRERHQRMLHRHDFGGPPDGPP